MSEPMCRSRQLTVPARPENIAAVHDLIASLWAQRPGLPAGDRLRFETAVIEVANNIVEHATARLAGVPEVTIELTLTATADRVTARFRDDGGPAQIDLALRMPDVMAEYGRGIALTRALVDEVIYERSGSANIWTVTCQRSDRSQP